MLNLSLTNRMRPLKLRLVAPPNSNPSLRLTSTRLFRNLYSHLHDVCSHTFRRSKQERESQIRAMRARSQKGVSWMVIFHELATDSLAAAERGRESDSGVP